MPTINYGNGNHTKVTLNADNDVILFGNGQGDALSLTGSRNTVTLGKGNNDATTLNGLFNSVTLGNGNNDEATVTNSAINSVVLGNGNNDKATVSGATYGSSQGNAVTLGDGNNDTATLSGGIGDRVTLGNGNKDTATLTGGSSLRATLGNGNNDAVTVRNTSAFHPAIVTLGIGHGDSVTINNGAAGVSLGAPGDTIDLTNSWLSFTGTDAMVFLNGDNFIRLSANSTGTQFSVGPTNGNDRFQPLSLAAQQTTVFDLKGDIGGFTSVTGPGGVLSALQNDGSGGTLLAFGPGNSLDIQGYAPDQFTAANFRIG